MRTYLPVRGLSGFTAIIAILSTFACNGSPTQPGQIADAEIGPRSRSVNSAPSLTDISAELAEPSELVSEDEGVLTTDDVEAEVADAEEDGEEMDAGSRDIYGLTSSTLTLSGVVRDKNYPKWTIPGATVKVTGLTAVKTSSTGSFSVRMRPGTVTITFTKTGYKTTSVSKTVRSSTAITQSLTAVVPSGMTVRCLNRTWMASKTLTGACSGRGGVAYWVVKPAALSSVTLTDYNVPDGSTVNGTVTLTKAAPSGGSKVLLSTTNSAVATVTSSVTIGAGARSASFKATAEGPGTTSIKAAYDKGTKSSSTLTVTGGRDPEIVVARFTYGPDDQCEVVENPGGVRATCTFDARTSTRPDGSTFTWAFPGGNTFTRSAATFTDVPLPCGTLPNGVFDRSVSLTVRSPAGAVSTYSLPVTFTKSGLC